MLQFPSNELLLLRSVILLSFYEEICKYYDFIFPVGRAQVSFITDVAGKPPKALLDVACGTGGYSLELAKQGYALTAIDLDAQMIELLKAKFSEKSDVKVLQGDMLELSQKLDSKYDLAFCIGNSLVHLNGEKEIEKFFSEAKALLVDEGNLVIQIINYDRVLAKNIDSLPTIEDKDIGLKFERFYRYDSNLSKIFFKTTLKVAGKELVNEIPLQPILSDKIVELLRNTGFNKIQLFGDFKRSKFDKNSSYALVLVAS